MTWDLAPTLRGRLVVVEPLGLCHEDSLWQAAVADRSIWRWTLSDPTVSRESFRAYLDDALADSDRAPFAVLDALSGGGLGSTSYLSIRQADRGIEIGHTWMARAAWGTGANVETKYLMLEHAFERLGCMRVEFKTEARNKRSRGALQGVGATFEGIHRKHRVTQYGVRDSAWYSVVDDEWPAVKAHLEERLGR